MSNLRQATQAALEALRYGVRTINHLGGAIEAVPLHDAIEALRAALAEPQPDLLECDIKPRPLSHPLRDYHIAISAGPLNYTWQDEPHRLVYDLIAAVRYYAAPQAQQPDGARAALIELEDEIARLKAPRKPMTDDQVRELVEECGLLWRQGFVPLYPGDTTNRYAVLVREVEGIYNSEAP